MATLNALDFSFSEESRFGHTAVQAGDGTKRVRTQASQDKAGGLRASLSSLFVRKVEEMVYLRQHAAQKTSIDINCHTQVKANKDLMKKDDRQKRAVDIRPMACVSEFRLSVNSDALDSVKTDRNHNPAKARDNPDLRSDMKKKTSSGFGCKLQLGICSFSGPYSEGSQNGTPRTRHSTKTPVKKEGFQSPNVGWMKPKVGSMNLKQAQEYGLQSLRHFPKPRTKNTLPQQNCFQIAQGPYEDISRARKTKSSVNLLKIEDKLK